MLTCIGFIDSKICHYHSYKQAKNDSDDLMLGYYY